MADKKTNSKTAATSAAPAAKTKKPTIAKTASATAASAGNSKKEKSLNDLVGTLAEKTGLNKTKAREFLDAHAQMLGDELRQNGSVLLVGVGKLKLGSRPERQGRNPATGEAVTIKASQTVKFAPGKAFKDGFR